MAVTQTKTSKAKSLRASGTASPLGRRKKVNVFHQRLGSLTYHQACQMLGDEGAKLIRQGDRFTEIDPENDVFLGGDLLRIKLHDCDAKYGGADEEPQGEHPQFGGTVITTMTLQSTRAKQIQTNCDCCDTHCHHVGAALAYLLDAKSVLGLAAPPDESVPLENLTEEELLLRAMAERQKRAGEEVMKVRSADTSTPWADYVTTATALARRTASRCEGWSLISRIALAPTSARMDWGPASISCTSPRKPKSGLVSMRSASRINVNMFRCGCITEATCRAMTLGCVSTCPPARIRPS